MCGRLMLLKTNWNFQHAMHDTAAAVVRIKWDLLGELAGRYLYVLHWHAHSGTFQQTSTSSVYQRVYDKHDLEVVGILHA